MEMSDQLHDPAPLSPGKEPCYPLDRRLGGAQNRCGHGVEAENSKPEAGT